MERALRANSKGNRETKETIEGKKEKKAFLDYLLDLSDQNGENGYIMTDTDIRNEVDTFMAAVINLNTGLYNR